MALTLYYFFSVVVIVHYKSSNRYWWSVWNLGNAEAIFSNLVLASGHNCSGRGRSDDSDLNHHILHNVFLHFERKRPRFNRKVCFLTLCHLFTSICLS